MKKSIIAFITILIISLYNTSVCYAGDVPEALLSYDAQLYFGEVTDVTDTTVTILPVKNVKGDVVLDTAITYYQRCHVMQGGSEQVGKKYLVGYIDEHNLYLWITDRMEPKTLKIKNATSMNLRLQEYLNNGDFEKAEEARLKKASAAAVPTALPTASQAASPSPSPVNSDSSIPGSAEAAEKPASGTLVIILAVAGALAIIVAFALVVLKKKPRSYKR